ncbi:hypothetical protein [Salinibacter ruber]|uniref:hypothetical protein n=1 Tax=Salinibacter ruber TaxID=146919 RepID=UPI002072AF71|nr:hypothetical protein [Salinibacter ruber]MCS4048941.1 hypothetical protein [Salinibacter ruber]
MPRGHDAPERPENTNEKPDQSLPAHENESEGPSMSRRDMLKKSAYAAPAIMTVGSVPRFAEGAPSCPDASKNGKGVGRGCGGPSNSTPEGGPPENSGQVKRHASGQHTDNQYTDDQYVDGEYADEKYGN